MDPIPVHIRWMIRRDMPEVLEIENASFARPWPEQEFIRQLRKRNVIGMVAEYDDLIVGVMLYELHKTKLHIRNFVVHPEYRHRDVGTQLVHKLISRLSHGRRNRIVLEIPETNLDAQLFFKFIGFEATSVLRGFCDESGEDAYQFEYRYSESAIRQLASELHETTESD